MNPALALADTLKDDSFAETVPADIEVEVIDQLARDCEAQILRDLKIVFAMRLAYGGEPGDAGEFIPARPKYYQALVQRFIPVNLLPSVGRVAQRVSDVIQVEFDPIVKLTEELENSPIPEPVRALMKELVEVLFFNRDNQVCSEGFARQLPRAGMALEIISRHVKSPDFVLDSDADLSWVMILNFVPDEIRFAAKNLIFNKLLADHLEKCLEKAEDGALPRIIPEVKAWLDDKAIANEYWAGRLQNSLGVDGRMSEEENLLIGHAGQESATLLESIGTSLGADFDKINVLFESISEFQQCVKDIAQSLEANMPEAYKIFKAEGGDPGHFSNLEVGTEAQLLLVECMAPMQKYEALYAVLFEDDEAQSEAYLRMIDRKTKYNLLPDGASANERVSGVMEAAGDINARLFVLDIDNRHDGRRAGIELAETLIPERLSLVEKLLREDPQHPVLKETTEIVVWSSSDELVQEAESALSSLIQEIDTNNCIKFQGVLDRHPKINVRVVSKRLGTPTF